MTHTPDATVPPDIAKLIDAGFAAATAYGQSIPYHDHVQERCAKMNTAAHALERAYASHTEPGLRRSLEIVDRQIQAYVTPNSDYSHGVMDVSKAFSKAIRTELDKLADDPIPEEWKSTPPATPDRAEADSIREALRGALAWGCIYGPVIAHKDWNEMREIMVEQFSAKIATPSGNHPAVVEALRDKIAEALWRAESKRAAGRDRLVPWSEINPEDKERWRGLADGVLPFATRPAPRVVTDDMIERAYLAYDRAVIDRMRHALEAALGQAAPGGEERP